MNNLPQGFSFFPGFKMASCGMCSATEGAGDTSAHPASCTDPGAVRNVGYGPAALRILILIVLVILILILIILNNNKTATTAPKNNLLLINILNN